MEAFNNLNANNEQFDNLQSHYQTPDEVDKYRVSLRDKKDKKDDEKESEIWYELNFASLIRDTTKIMAESCDAICYQE